MELVSRIQTLLSRVTYKPGWKFECWPTYASNGRLSDREISIITSFTAVNAENPSSTEIFHSQNLFPAEILENMTDADLVLHVIRECIFRVEMHEVDEWLKFNGKCVREPHPELMRAPASLP
jgi:hypothetical protein